MEDAPDALDVATALRKEDYFIFFKYYFFKRKLAIRLIVWLTAYGYVAANTATAYKNDHNISDFTCSLIVSSIMVFGIAANFLTPYLIILFRWKKKLGVDANLTNEKHLKLTAEGIHVTSSSNSDFWKYTSLKEVGMNSKHIFLMMFGKTLYLIPISCFPNKSSAANFYSTVQRGLSIAKAGGDYKNVSKVYYWGLMGIIPMWGAISGIVLVILGLTQYKDKLLVTIGVAGIAVTTCFIFFMKSDFMSENLRRNTFTMVPGELNTLVKDIEIYKLQHGSYPDSLKYATVGDQFSPLFDPMIKDQQKADHSKYYYHYYKLNNRYTLYSVGLDGIAGTADDLYPTLGMNDTTKFGLIKAK